MVDGTPGALPLWVPLLVVATVPFVILKAKVGVSATRTPSGTCSPAGMSGRRAGWSWTTRSASFSTLPWVQLDWGSDLAMAGAYAAAGLAGIALLFAIANIMVFWAIYLACRQRAGVLVSGLAGVIGWIGTYASLGMRPQTVSFILLGLTLVGWHGVWARHARPRWWLIPLTWVWACLHGLWFLGPLVGVLVVCGMALDRRSVRGLTAHGLVPVLSIVVAALTPIGPRLLGLPLTVNSYAGLVAEWRPPDIHQPYVAATVLLLVVTAVGWAEPPQCRHGWTCSCGSWRWAGPCSMRVRLPSAPSSRHRLPRLPSSVSSSPPRPRTGRLEGVTVAASTAVAIVVAAVLVPTIASRPVGMPDDLDSSLRQLPAGKVVLNDDAVGGWLLLEHPELKPVIDTRTYLFEVPYIKRYMAARTASEDYGLS